MCTYSVPAAPVAHAAALRDFTGTLGDACAQLALLQQQLEDYAQEAQQLSARLLDLDLLQYEQRTLCATQQNTVQKLENVVGALKALTDEEATAPRSNNVVAFVAPASPVPTASTDEDDFALFDDPGAYVKVAQNG